MFNVCLINSYLVFSFWFLLFAFFYDNVTAIRCMLQLSRRKKGTDIQTFKELLRKIIAKQMQVLLKSDCFTSNAHVCTHVKEGNASRITSSVPGVGSRKTR